MAEKTYLEVFREHYPNVVLKEFFGNYCPAGFFEYGMDMHHPDCTAECDKCWLCTADSEWRENGEYDVPEVWKAMAVQDKPSEPPATVQSERAEEISGAFNYAVLTAELGDYLRRKEEQLKNEYMNFTANCGRIFAEAQEKLAKNGFGEENGLFRKWIASMGFAKTTVYRMIDIYKFRLSQIGTDEGQAFFDALPKTLQADISAPSAPPELVEQVMNGDITTHKEYIALKKELEAAEEHNAVLTAEKEQFHKASKANLEKLNEERERNAELEKQLSEVKWSLDISEIDVRKAEERAEYAENKVTEISVKNRELERRLKEIESRPIDVAVDVDELNRRVSEAANKMNSEMEHTLAAERKDFADTLNAKDEKIWALEDEVKKLKNCPTYTHNEKILAFQMSMNQYKQLLEIVSGSNNNELYEVLQSVKIFS